MKKIGKYQITEILGKGAMGIVYKALDPDITREAAIKTIRFDLITEESDREELMKRFIREAQAAGKLVHPNIITIYDVGREEDLTYIVMQYIEGPSLQKMITSGDKFTPQEVIQLMNHLCDALEYAHQEKIVHRDIKPANILIDKTGKPFIVDFGVARVETSTLTQTGATIGTPSYMSPEQIMGEKADNRSDIFSLGVILYELLAGKKPFEGDSITTVFYKIINEEPLSIGEVKKDLPKGFEHILSKALSKDPKNRYQTCSQLAADLNALSQLSEKTIVLDTTEEEAVSLERKRKLRRRILAVSIPSVLLVCGAAALFLSQKGRKLIFPSRGVQVMEAEVSPLPSRSIPLIFSIIEDKLIRIEKSLEKGNFAEAIKLAEEVLSEDSENTKARKFLNEALIAQNLAEGVSSYNKGDYRQCKRMMERILKLEKENQEALRYWFLADRAISKKEILRILERQRKTEEEKDLLSLLSDIGSPAFSGQRKADAILLFNYYDEIKSVISNISVNFRDRNNADVSFSHILTAVYKKTGEKKVVFEGTKTWTFKKQEKTWKIIGSK